VAVQERGDPERVLRVAAHPIRQGPDPASDEPASNGEGTAPADACTARIRSKSSSRTFDTTAPPSTSPWPPRYFVVAWTTRSAPSLSGVWSTGVAVRVVADVAGAACRAISPTAARSVIFHSGFDGVSTQTRRVLARIAARTAARSAMSTNVVSSFQRAKVSRRSREVPW